MKRPAIPTRVKVDVIIRQDGRCACGCGERLVDLKNTNFDHSPALCFRDFDEATGEFNPPANDPSRIFAKRVECHRLKTSGNAATSSGSDIHMNAKVNNPKRTAKFVVTKPALGEERPARPKQKMQSRGFDKTWKRPMNPRKRSERKPTNTVNTLET